MGTPRKNLNYFSPYSQNKGQYPSQNSEYLSQHTGGLQQPDRQQQNSQRGTPHFYQNRTPQPQTCGFFEDRQSSSGNTPAFYRNKTPQQGQHRNFGHRGGRRGFHNQQQHQRQFNNKNEDTFSQYFHNSMLEDPWHELMERHNAIHGSVVEDDAPKTELNT